MRYFVFLLVSMAAVSAPAQTFHGPVTPLKPLSAATIQAEAQSPKPMMVSLQDAVRLAEANASQFRTAVTDAGMAHEDQVQARAALLPSLSYETGAIFTQANGTGTGIFIGNNGPNEYISQGDAHQALSLALLSDFRRARALEAVAKAKLEIARRGLVTTVVKSYYGEIVAANKFQNAQAGAAEAQRFLKLTQQLEQGGEVAHSDVIKAQLQANERELAAQNARLAEESAKLALAVLIFPNFNENFEVVNDLQQAPVLPEFARAQELAAHNNPEIGAATKALEAAQHEVTSTVGDRLPSVSVDYFYGIDATRYAVRTDNLNNLGYSVVATLNLPVFQWGALHSKTKQAQLQRELARVQLNEAQRTAVANLRIFYHEAETARGQLDLLRQSVDLAAESLRLTTLRYQGGEATALEVVDAQNALLSAHDAYDDGAARYRAAIAQLQTLTGNF